jgi:hypothetical protein
LNAFTDLKQFSFKFFFRSFRHCVSCFAPKADHVANGFKTKKKKEYKDDFFKNNIDSVAMQLV